MVKVNINLKILHNASSPKRNVQLQPGRRVDTTFQTGMMQTCC